MLSDSSHEIRQQADSALSEFLQEIKNSPVRIVLFFVLYNIKKYAMLHSWFCLSPNRDAEKYCLNEGMRIMESEVQSVLYVIFIDGIVFEVLAYILQKVVNFNCASVVIE